MLYPRAFAILIVGAGALAMHPAAQEGVPGAWRLAEVGGKALPVVTEEGGGCREEVTAATLTLAADGRWTLAVTEREVCGQRAGEEQEEERGTYTVQGAAVTFARDDASARDDDPPAELEIDEPVSATLEGGALSVRLENGAVAVFRR